MGNTAAICCSDNSEPIASNGYIKSIGDTAERKTDPSAPPYQQRLPRTYSSYENMTSVLLAAVPGDEASPATTSGLQRMRDSNTNKGQAFTIEERQALGIHGLLPPAVKTMEDQMAQIDALLERLDKPLSKFLCIMSLYDLNKSLFFRYFDDNIMTILPIIYTPIVGEACLKYSLIFDRPRSLFITIYDKGHVYEVLKNWPERDVRVIVVTDGERILGLGDLGANGTPIPVGKLALYTGIAGVKPHHCLPITIDVGTNNKEFLNDPLYIGLREERVRGEAYDELMDEFMEAVSRRFGSKTVVQFEDFGNANAFRLLKKYREKYCCFNDDIQGTAGVAVAGVLASTRILKKKVSELTIVFFGAGECNLGIGELLTMAMVQEGLQESEARKKMWFLDSKGLLVKDRPSGGITDHKKPFAQDAPFVDTLLEVVEKYKPDVLIGAATIPGVFTKEVLETMARNKERPVIFALSNPTSKAECTAEQAYTYTNGKCIFASGSPFDPVTINGITYAPGQSNNAYIFPAIGMAATLAGIKYLTDEIFLRSAAALADSVQEDQLAKGSVFPPVPEIRQVSERVIVELLEYAYKARIATVYPEPKDKRAFLMTQMYKTDYASALPPSYPVPSSKI